MLIVPGLSRHLYVTTGGAEAWWFAANGRATQEHEKRCDSPSLTPQYQSSLCLLHRSQHVGPFPPSVRGLPLHLPNPSLDSLSQLSSISCTLSGTAAPRLCPRSGCMSASVLLRLPFTHHCPSRCSPTSSRSAANSSSSRLLIPFPSSSSRDLLHSSPPAPTWDDTRAYTSLRLPCLL